MSSVSEDRSSFRVSVVDDDPLRSRREVRELHAALVAVDPAASLDFPGGQAPGEGDKGGAVLDAVSLVFSGTAAVAAVTQVWLARVPQRTITVRRPDGATLRITGREARADDGRIERFLTAENAEETEDVQHAESTGDDTPADDGHTGPPAG